MCVALYVTSTGLAQSNPDLVGRFTTAMKKSLAYADSHPDEVRAVLGTYTQIAENPTVHNPQCLPRNLDRATARPRCRAEPGPPRRGLCGRAADRGGRGRRDRLPSQAAVVCGAGARIPARRPAAGPRAHLHPRGRHRRHDEGARHRLRLRLARPAQHGRRRPGRRPGARRRLPRLPDGRAAAPASVRAPRGEPADRHRRPPGPLGRHHPHGDQRTEGGQRGTGLHHPRIPDRIPVPADVERCAAARAHRGWRCRCCSVSSKAASWLGITVNV